jgi:hypothetical protein
MSRYYVGLDLGQAADYTALCVAERIGDVPHRYDVSWLQRFALGTSYVAIVERVAALLGGAPLRGASTLVVDMTGVGRPVVDLFRRAGLKPEPVTITGGDRVSQEDDEWRVPKRDLAAVVKVLLQSERLKIARALPEADTLVQELLGFEVKISLAGHDSYGTWREGVHDDLLLATALAVWAGEHIPAPIGWRAA